MGKKKIILTKDAPTSVGPYSQAVEAGGTLFLSGQIPIDPETGEVLTGDIQAAARQVLNNIKAVLKGAGYSMDNVVRTTIYLTDMSQFAKVNDVYKEYFSQEPPARSTVGVLCLPKGANIEIDAIAVKAVTKSLKGDRENGKDNV